MGQRGDGELLQDAEGRTHAPASLRQTSVMITTNLTFTEWANVFGDAKMTTALLDGSHASLPHRGNRKRVLPLPTQQYRGEVTHSIA